MIADRMRSACNVCTDAILLARTFHDEALRYRVRFTTPAFRGNANRTATRLHRDLWWHCASGMRPPEFTDGTQRRRDGRVESLLLEDAFSGGPGAIRRLAQAARGHFIGATEVLVNVTGGTTLMGLAAEELAATARSLACPARRFGLIDRRPPEQQDADPYHAGEPFWLDAQEDEDAN